MFSLLLQPYPNKWVNPKRWQIEFFLGALVFVVMLLFNPSFLEMHTPIHRVSVAFAHAAMCIISLFFLRRVGVILFPRFMEDEFWTGYKVLLINALDLTFMGICSYLLAVCLGELELTALHFSFFQMQVFILGFLPLTFADILHQVFLQEKHDGRARLLNHQLRALPPDLVFSHSNRSVNNPLATHFVVIRGAHPQENFNLGIEKGLFMQTEGHFVRVYYCENKQVKTVLIRTNLKKVMEDLKNVPQYCRCHTNYLVNTNKIMSVEGNAQGYKLELEGVGQFIPAAYTQEILRRTNISTRVGKLDLVY
ncbi:MAG: hypothetical protein RL329_385 [Bacteroidota bacterium]